MILQIVLGIIGLGICYSIRHILGGIFGLYRIVPVNEAHIRILGNTKKIFSSRTGKSAYWIVPSITKLHKLPLCNLAIPVNDVKLNDKNMAKFVTDIMCFVNIKDLDLAVERLILTDASREMGFDFIKLSEDLRAIMESVGRTVTTKQTILDIYMNRGMLDQAITKEVEVVFPKWGIELVDLELKDIKDAPDSTIIHDIEVKVASEIRRDAQIKIAETNKEAKMAEAENEEIFRKRQIAKDEAIGIAEQEKNQKISFAATEANIKSVEARRKIDVGMAEIEKQKTEQLAQATQIKMTVEADGQKQKSIKEAEGVSEQTTLIGTAEANIIKIKKLAEAEGTLKLAEAMKQFNDVAINVKVLDINKEIQIAKFQAFAQALSKADIKWILSGDNAQKFFGLNLDAQGGANLEQFLTESGLGEFVPKIKELLEKKTK
jgi:uncharacterized membrane protein YqiK